jgi:hypothetical protein
VRIGERINGLRAFDGDIDAVSIWSRALSAAEIATLMTAPPIGSEAGLVAALPLNELSGQVANDLGPGGHHGQLGSLPAADTNDPVWCSNTPINQPPVVNAGSDAILLLPQAMASLGGTVTDDGLPSPGYTVAWSVDSGPNGVTFGNASSATTTVTFPVSGTYILRLTANDGELSAADTLVVQVDAVEILTNLQVSPATVVLADGAAQQFTAAGFNQVGNPMTIAPVWSANAGTIDPSG